MYINEIHLTAYKRFTDLTVSIPGRARLVVVCGPNGAGKSSLFDAILVRHLAYHGGWSADPSYYDKTGVANPDGPFNINGVRVALHDLALTPGAATPINAFYVRSAYRNDPDFSVSQITSPPPLQQARTINRLIDNDQRVSENYQRLVGQSVASLYAGDSDNLTVVELRERLIKELATVLSGVFPELLLVGPGNPFDNGTFLFAKGTSVSYRYKNLSGGEKAVFDLLLDLIAKREGFDDTVFCIDEPEAHVNPRVHGALLDAMLSVISETSQLWLATHSAGIMKRARDLHESGAIDVAFLDFDLDFDSPQTVIPIQPDRSFWQRALSVAFGDMADLVAPARVVLCEGDAAGGSRAEFDARCLRTIFQSAYGDTEFLAVGNDREVINDIHGVGKAIATLAPGSLVFRLIDRDARTPQEILQVKQDGTRILNRRHLESYLVDDEVLEKLCISVGQAGKWPELKARKQQAHANSTAPPRNNPPDDWKSCAGEIFNAAKQVLQLQQPGNNTDAFLRDTLAPLVEPGMSTYQELRDDVFGP